MNGGDIDQGLYWERADYMINMQGVITIKTKAVITVFLSLIMLLILSLLFTVIEAARISIARVYAERAMTTAMDSVLAEFYEPLWKEYHIFGLYEGETQTSTKEKAVTKIKEYMSCMLTPSKGVDNAIHKSVNLYDFSINKASITEKTMLTDYQGSLFINEAVENTKYSEAGNAIKLMLEKLSVMEDASKVRSLYEEELKVKEQLVGIDESILELMELLDGIQVNRRGVVTNKSGDIQTGPYYVKKLCIGEITKGAVGIFQDNLYQILKEKYVNPMESLKLIEKSFSQIKKTEEQIAKIESKIKTEKNGGKLEKQRNELIEQKEQHNHIIQEKSADILNLVSELMPLIKESIDTINGIHIKSKSAEPVITAYEALLYREHDKVEGDLFAKLEKELMDIKKYIGTGGMQLYDFEGMKQILAHDLAVLAQTEKLFRQAEGEMTELNLLKAEESYQKAKDALREYEIEGLVMDYSSLVCSQKKINVADTLVNSLTAELMTLVMSPDTVSQKGMPKCGKPSDMALLEKEEGSIQKLLLKLQNIFNRGDNSGIEELFEQMDKECKNIVNKKDGISILAEKILFREYIRKHFSTFVCREEYQSVQKPSVLDYEQEYLIAGEGSDKDNLSRIIGKIIALRMAADFVPICTNSVICKQANALATALVGFTGLPILVGITQTVILLIWTFAEALVDTAALLMGKEVLIIKKEIAIKLENLLRINRKEIMQKASEIKDENGVAFVYKDYIQFFIYLKKEKELAYRSMDLVEKNLQIRYEKAFSIQKCLYGYEAKTVINLKPVFTAFSFVKRYLENGAFNNIFQITASYSY